MSSQAHAECPDLTTMTRRRYSAWYSAADVGCCRDSRRERRNSIPIVAEPCLERTQFKPALAWYCFSKVRVSVGNLFVQSGEICCARTGHWNRCSY